MVLPLPLSVPEMAERMIQLWSAEALQETGRAQFPTSFSVISFPGGEESCTVEAVNERLEGETCKLHGWAIVSVTESV